MVVKKLDEGSAIKFISWNARTLAVKVGNNLVNKVAWVRYVAEAEVISIQ